MGRERLRKRVQYDQSLEYYRAGKEPRANGKVAIG